MVTNVMWGIFAQKAQTSLFPVALVHTAVSLSHLSVIHAPVDIFVLMELTPMTALRDFTVL